MKTQFTTFLILLLIWAVFASTLLCISLILGCKNRLAASRWSAWFGFIFCAVPCIVYILSTGETLAVWLGAVWVSMNFEFLFAATIIALHFHQEKMAKKK